MSELDARPTTPATAAAIAATGAYPKTFTTTGGKSITVTRNLKGRDAAAAERVARDGSNIERSLAMVAPVLLVNGQPVVMEDLLEMDLDELGEILEGAQGGNAPTSTPKP